MLVVLESKKKKKLKARKKIYCVLNIPQEKTDKKACQFKDRTDLLFFLSEILCFGLVLLLLDVT